VVVDIGKLDVTPLIQPNNNLDMFTASDFLPFIMNLDMDFDGLDITEVVGPVMASLSASVFSPSDMSDMFVTPSSMASGSSGG
jgi:hypothetical protein